MVSKSKKDNESVEQKCRPVSGKSPQYTAIIQELQKLRRIRRF